MLAVRFLRAPLAAATSAATSSPARIHRFGKFYCVRSQLKSEGLNHLEFYRLHNFSCESFVSRRFCQNVQCLWNSGRKITKGSSMLVYAAVGSSMSLWTKNACFADDDHSPTDSWVALPRNERRYSRIILLMHKLMVPLFLVFDLWTKWGQTHPLFLAGRVMLIFLSTKPAPSSIYIFVDRLRYQIMSQQPLWYRNQTLHANRVEVEDYTLLCLAKVHIKDERLVLVGFLGGWWILPFSSWDEVFLFDKLSWKEQISLVKNRFRLSADRSWY